MNPPLLSGSAIGFVADIGLVVGLAAAVADNRLTGRFLLSKLNIGRRVEGRLGSGSGLGFLSLSLLGIMPFLIELVIG